MHALVYALYITDGLDIKSAAEVPRLRKRVDTPLPPNATAATAESLSGAHKMPSGVTSLPLEPSGTYKIPTGSGAFKFRHRKSCQVYAVDGCCAHVYSVYRHL